MSDIKVTPTGCPGPVPGTKTWICDGEQCVYNADYNSCKQEIERRGYSMVLAQDYAEQVKKEASLVEASLATQLAKEHDENIAKEYTLRVQLQDEQNKQQLTAQDADHLAECYVESLLANERTSAYARQLEQDKDALVASLAQLEEQSLVTASELAQYKDKERWYEQERATLGATDSGHSDSDDGVDTGTGDWSDGTADEV